MLKHWRSAGGGGDAVAPAAAGERSVNKPPPEPASTSVLRSRPAAATDADSDEGPFFDLEFDGEYGFSDDDSTSNGGEDDEKEEEAKFVVLSGDGGEPKLDPNAKPHSPVVAMFSKPNSAKLHVLMLGFKKPWPPAASPSLPKQSKRAADDQEKKQINSKDALQRYLKSKFKPLYVIISRRHGGGAEKKAAAPPPPAASRRRLGKSRSASAAVAAVRSPPLRRRRDDSLLEQQDGIQSAIAHCKRSFNADRVPLEAATSSTLLRSSSDPGEYRI